LDTSQLINVAVLFGGRSSEHDVSLGTGCMICNSLDRSRYRVKPVLISRLGKWLLPRRFLEDGDILHPDDYASIPTGGAPVQLRRIGACDVTRGPERLLEDANPIDVFFIGLHGPFGEDGAMQGLLEIIDVAYTGCDVQASAHALDKVLSKHTYVALGITTPNFAVISQGSPHCRNAARLVEGKIGYPCVVKPATQGSSYGVTICQSEKELPGALEESFRFHRDALVEEFIGGIELSCGVLEDPATGKLQPLPLIEIVPKESVFFDYHAKYTPGATDEICPARISPERTQRIQDISLAACDGLGISGFSRVDFILRDEIPYLLEINTIPGMTTTSLLPKEAMAAGIAFPEMLDRIIQSGVRAHRERQARRH